MGISGQLKQWFSKFERYKASYKDGFFCINNLANSPFTIIESFDKMPFCKHVKEKKLMQSDTLFFKAQFYYAELEEGLWVLVSDTLFKKNLAFKNIYDKSLPINYHFLNLYYNNKPITSKSMLVNGIIVPDKTWSVFKAGNAVNDYHFKDVHENNVTVYFTDEWFAKQQHKGVFIKNNCLTQFLQSTNSYLVLRDSYLNNYDWYKTFFKLVSNNGHYENNEQLKHLVLDFFKQFIATYKQEAGDTNNFTLPDKDRKIILKTEKYLMDMILQPFAGIETIAQKMGVSPTKLKNDFKTIHNQTLYNYYRCHQMNLAHKLLSEKQTTVKEVATLLGYENASKFSAAFKEQFGMVPSRVVKV